MQGEGSDSWLQDLGERKPPFVFQTEYLCDGKFADWSGPYQEVFSPVCEKAGEEFRQILIGKYPLLDEAAALSVLEGAGRAYQDGSGEWPTMSPKRRIRHFEEFLREFRKIRTEVVELLMWEIGKTKADAEKEFDRTVEYTRATIDYYKQKAALFNKPRSKGEILGFVMLCPRGIVLCMGPYNYPLNETFTTLIPALITGNVVIFKPPRLGVLLHRPILKIFQKVFPHGAVSTVYGEGQKVISPLISTGRIDVLAFIGSSRVADILKRLHPKPHRLHTIFGLEAKNPAIILKDANLDEIVDECISGALGFNGQRCTALKLFMVERDIAEAFAQKLSAKISELKLALPWEEGAKITPLPETSRTHYLLELIEDAKNYGAKVVNSHGGESQLTYFKPAVLYPVTEKMRVFHEEQFGPVVPIFSFDNLEAVANIIVHSDYGQQLSIFSNDRKRIQETIRLLGNQVTRININAQCQRGPDTMPFTGRKDSAEGVLSISEAIKEFTLPLVLATKNISKNKKLI